MRRLLAIISVACAGALVSSCGLDKPDGVDGSCVLILQAVDTSGVYSPDWTGVANAKVDIASATFAYKNTFTTDETGKIVLEGLPLGDYYIQASMRDEEHDVLLTGQKKKRLRNEEQVKDTLFMSFVPMSPIVINELYYAGCNGSSFYFYDQFVELYNSTDDTLYVDGFVVCRSQQSDGLIDLEAEDFALAYYMYQFPGTRGVTRQCPIAPKGFLVLACDAINHHNCGALCVNLLNADYEFFNAAQNDYDNLLVPNILPVSTVGKDFTMSLGHTAILIATGEEYTFAEYTTSSGVSPFIQVPLRTILDAVEVADTQSSTFRRYWTLRIDAGLGGNGLPKYGGQSVERKVPGFDSNNSSFDFDIVGSPTPGYSH
ncbi:MAG: DUF4876 domain-containing protein [Candidatus Krumholzibacteriia bacterium]